MRSVLFIDDEVNLVFILKKFFQEKKWRVLAAYNGKDGLKLAKEKKPGVIVLDVRMPGMDGIEVLKRLKKTNHTAPVIMLTAYGSEDYIRQCMELGASEFLSKPFDLKELERTIQKILRVGVKS